jgi:membrane protease YdiL (CAAX protease family)
MIDAKNSIAFRRVFYNHSELHAGWRLLIFVAIVIALSYATNQMFRRLPRGAGSDVSFLAFELMDFLIFVFASWIMALIEHRTVADYGLPWRKMFRLQFWQGVLVGFAFITTLLLGMRVAGVFYLGSFALHGADIWKWAMVYAIVFLLVALREEFRARGYALYTLSAGIGFWPAAIVSAAYFGYSHHGNSGEDWIGLFTLARLDCYSASCCVERAICGFLSGFTWLSTGADVLLWCGRQWTDTARSSSELQYVRYGVAFWRHGRSRRQCTLLVDSARLVDLRTLFARGQISQSTFPMNAETGQVKL